MAEDRQRAEVFDALAHPTRIRILKALEVETLTFSDLKKRMTIESSGHLQHHLSKLHDLVKTDKHGSYCLSEQGKDALFTVQIVENTGSFGGERKKHHTHYAHAPFSPMYRISGRCWITLKIMKGLFELTHSHSQREIEHRRF